MRSSLDCNSDSLTTQLIVPWLVLSPLGQCPDKIDSLQRDHQGKADPEKVSMR